VRATGERDPANGMDHSGPVNTGTKIESVDDASSAPALIWGSDGIE
jgi:hypothetical protein